MDIMKIYLAKLILSMQCSGIWLVVVLANSCLICYSSKLILGYLI